MLRRIAFGLVLSLLSLASFNANAQFTPASGYWWNSGQSGRGFVIEIQGSQMFMAGFLYAASGEATWVASVGPMTSATEYSGPLVTYTGGQTLTGSYQLPSLSPNLGTLSLSFTDASHANLIWPGGTLAIERFDFGPGGSATAQPAGTAQAGWWWNPAESGRGFAIEVQGGSIYFAGYMYDGSGNPLWYLASGPMGTTVNFQGEWTQYANGQTLTGAYQAPSLANNNAGNVTLQFTSPYTATLTLPNSREIPLLRFGFGVTAPVLSNFSPSQGVPETLLTVNGTGFDPTGTVTLTLADSTGYSVSVPVSNVTATAVQVAVPPYINASNGAFGTGAVTLTATQTVDGVSLASNVVGNFTIQALPAVSGSAGNSTLALITADLDEAQKLETSITGTAQATPAVTAALAQQVNNLQSLVTHIQAVVQNGASYSLGAVDGVDITVTSSNIGDVDSLILAALNALANPPAGALKTAQGANPGCLSAEAQAFANGITAGAGNLTQLAQNFLEASNNSSACSTVGAFTSAYQIFGGAADVGLGIANGQGGGVVGSRLPGAALFAVTTENASASIGLNALISPALASQVGSVQTAIAQVAAQSDPAADQLVAKSTGPVATSVAAAQTVVQAAVPPTSGTGSSASIAGVVAGNGPVSFAAITISDVNGNTVGATAAVDGTYSAAIGGLTAPVFIVATDPSGTNGPMMSISATLPDKGSAIINVTPLTTAICAMLTYSGDIFSIDSNSVGGITPAEISNAVSILNAALAPIVTANGLSVSGNNPITANMAADDTGNDAVANAVNLFPYGTGLQLVATADPTQTLVLDYQTAVPSTPLPAPPVASNYLDFMQVELQKCLAVPLNGRSTDATCNGILDPAFLSNGYTTLATAFSDFALPTSVGAKVARPKTLEFFTSTTGGYQVALVRFRYTLTDGTLGRIIVVMREVPAGTTPVTLPDGTVAAWNFYGNQGNYDASVVTRAIRETYLSAGTQSFYAFGPAFIFNPSGPNAANVNSVNITGPGLPGAGIWLFRSSACGTANYMAISGAVRSGPPNGGTQTFTTSTTTGFKWSWAPLQAGTTFVPPTNAQWAVAPVSAASIPFASLYTFQLYDVNGNSIASFTRRNVAPPVDATFAPVTPWPTLSGATQSDFLVPGGALTGSVSSFTAYWTNPPLGLPAFQVEAGSGPETGTTPATVDGFGLPTGTTADVAVTAGASTNGEITSVCSGSQFSAFAAGLYRFIEIQGRDPSDIQVFDNRQYNN